MAHVDVVPIWAFFFGTIGIVLFSLELGFRVGRKAREGSGGEGTTGAKMSGDVLGLVSFILAFTFGLASARYDSRKQLVREEAGIIRTAFLRSDFLAERERGEVKSLLRSYVDLRVGAAQSMRPELVEEGIVKTNVMLRRLWELAAELGNRERSSEVAALYIDSLNEVFEVHAKRLAVATARIPWSIWLSLYAIAGFGMVGSGYQAGLGGTRSTVSTTILVLSFSLVISLIAALDRPTTVYAKANQKPLIELRKAMGEAGASVKP